MSERRAEQPANGFLLLALVLFSAAWFVIYLTWSVPFWSAHEDCVFLSLAHAIHLEASLRGEAVGADAGLVGHPGIPFYVVSWLALRAANVFGARAAEASDVLASAEGFFLASRIAAGVITAAGIAAAGVSAPV